MTETTTPKTLTDARAIEVLEEIVKGNEAYVYYTNRNGIDGKPLQQEHDAPSSCFYTNVDGTPSCIIGHFIAREIPEALAWVNKTENETYGSLFVAPLMQQITSIYRVVVPTSVKQILARAQQAQDHGHTWGEALAAAKKLAERLDSEAEGE